MMKNKIFALALGVMLALLASAAQQPLLPTDTLPEGLLKLNANDSELYGFMPAGTVVGTTDTQTLTNKTISGASNTLTVRLENDVTGTLPVANGGTGAATLTGLLQGNGTSAVTAITNSTTVGQLLRVTGSNAYGWGALDLADADAVTGILPTANGGTANAFFTVSGPATSAKTFTFPNASSTVLTSNAAVTLDQGGTGLTSAADDTVLNSNGSAWSAVSVPNCTDSGGNHLNYTASSNAFSCGTSAAAPSSTIVQRFKPLDADLPATNFPQFKSVSGTNFPVSSLAFDGGSTNEDSYFSFYAEKYASGNVTVRVKWYADTASTGDVRFGAAFACITPNTDTTDIETKGFDTATEGNDTHLGTTNQRLHEMTLSLSAIDSMTAGDYCILKFYRDASDTGNDTMTGDALVTSVNVEYTGTL